MRKVRDYDSELKALEERARQLKARRVEQLGALVASTGADTLDLETLAGALLDAVASRDTVAKEAWRAKGVAFFHRQGRKPVSSEVEAGRRTADGDRAGAAAQSGAGAAPGSGAASD